VLIAFLGRDNVLEVALGLIIGAAFSNVVTSLVADIILPPITLISPNSRNLESHFVVLRHGDTPDVEYNTREQAAADGTTHLIPRLIIRSYLPRVRIVHTEGTLSMGIDVVLIFSVSIS